MAGRIDVEVMLRHLTPRKFRDWEAYYELKAEREGMPESLKADYRAASIRKTIADVFRGEQQAPYEIERFRLLFGEEAKKAPEPPKQQPWESQLAFANIIALAHNSLLIQSGELKKAS